MPGKDLTRWQVVAGDHADDTAYEKLAQDPLSPPTDEQNTTLAATPDVNATQGAIETAAQLGVDLTTVEGTGTGGRVTKADVEAAAN